MLQQVSGRTVLLDNRAAPATCKAQASSLLAAVDGVLSSLQLGSFSAPAWTLQLPPSSAGALRADITDDTAAAANLTQGWLACCSTMGTEPLHGCFLQAHGPGLGLVPVGLQ